MPKVGDRKGKLVYTEEGEWAVSPDAVYNAGQGRVKVARLSDRSCDKKPRICRETECTWNPSHCRFSGGNH